MADATSNADPTADAEAGTEEQPQPFENRAARRSKGKATADQRGYRERRPRPFRHGAEFSPYGNRRSG